jgi:hypothetical protein
MDVETLRPIANVEYDMGLGKYGEPCVWAILTLENGKKVRIGDDDLQKILDKMP